VVAVVVGVVVIAMDISVDITIDCRVRMCQATICSWSLHFIIIYILMDGLMSRLLIYRRLDEIAGLVGWFVGSSTVL